METMTASLPMPTVPTYNVELPVSKQKIKFRPFLVKEEKILLLANESKDPDIIIDSILQVLEMCTMNKVNVRKLPVADCEFLFIKVRANSIGEVIEGTIECKKCNSTQDYPILLDNITVENNAKDKIVKLDKDTIVTMKYPTLEIGKGLSKLKDTDIPLALVASMIESISMKEKVYDVTDYPKETIITWLENCSEAQVQIISEFLAGLPKVVYRDEQKCKKCGADIHVYVEGIEPFFS